MEDLSLDKEMSSRDVHSEPPQEIAHYFDAHRHVISWPGKKAARQLLFAYIASFFEQGRSYSEKEVNALLSDLVSAIDCATLRRDLYDFRYLKRTRDGSQYWREEQR